MKHARPDRDHRPTARAALAALLALVSLTLTQCTTVGDSLTGVTLDPSIPASCVTQCKDLYANLFGLEEKRHVTEVEHCQAIDDDRLRKDCFHAESARHSAAVDQLAAGKVSCLENCNRPGSGSAG